MFNRHRGQCHCGAVKFELDYEGSALVQECNCSICSVSGFLHLIVPGSQFRLLEGEQQLLHYTFNTGVAQHSFCKVCGIKPFYVPRSNPDGYSINFRCLDASEFSEVVIEPFDGQNWEQHGQALAGLSRPDPER